ncbi:hypothetical protein AB4090_04685 [Acidithiobacillus sp. IBUN Pt1247-S3]|uniref:hypothetical protein n=1 Tax=Acidithiobacillus sp. IBUN Pt1247-S3 TaxID=3166642 RepID=UPI0034E5B397
MQFLTSSERNVLLDLLQQRDGEIDVRGQECDCHLVFEALHLLADGMPERLYAIIHHQGRRDHLQANAGNTFLMVQKIAESGAMACG